MTAHRRTVPSARDIAAVAMVKIGSGCNLMGFYMYAGGTNPDGKLTTLQESTDTGYPNDLPIKSYDFRAPIGEFGAISPTCRELKLLSYFVRDFGEELCDLPAIISDDNPLNPADTTHLRYSFRSDGAKGYLFVNNYVRHQKMAEHSDVCLLSPDGKTRLPSLNVKNGEFFFLPFNMEVGGAKIKTARVTPFCSFSCSEGEKTLFYARDGVQYAEHFFDFESAADEEKARKNFVVLSRADALNCWKAGGHLFILEGSAIENENGRTVISGRGAMEFFSYPALEKTPSGFERGGLSNRNLNAGSDLVNFVKYMRKSDSLSPCEIAAEDSGLRDGKKCYRLDFSAPLGKIGAEGISDCFVRVDYTGERAALYATQDGKRKLLLDHFYLGADYPWEIGLKRFIGASLSNLELEITPLKKDANIYFESRPDFAGDEIATVNSVRAEYEWSQQL